MLTEDDYEGGDEACKDLWDQIIESNRVLTENVEKLLDEVEELKQARDTAQAAHHWVTLERDRIRNENNAFRDAIAHHVEVFEQVEKGVITSWDTVHTTRKLAKLIGRTIPR